MSVPLSYLGIVLIWSTTPLAVKWSTEGSSFIFAVSSRIWLATALSILLLVLMKKTLPLHWRALQLYLASATGLYGAMMCIYWASQYIPSGIMSIVFGTAPLVTGVIAALWLGEKSLSLLKLFGMGLGITGLFVIFAEGPSMGEMAVYGILVQCIGVIIHCVTLVWVKALKSDMPAISMTTGGLLLACIPYTITWYFMGAEVPHDITGRAISAIAYLALVGSLFAFVLMFYVIKHIDASTMALIPLITPVLSLTFGRLLNNEFISLDIVIGASLIICGLLFYNWSAIARFFGLMKTGMHSLIPVASICWGEIRKGKR